ncbi:MAG: response regulator transcription factor [Lachnospiraceae bacterium]|nr:response regulator transcription factor [Lachnospiraceae bacterium]
MPKIMIIEDDPAVREELTLLLANEGYQSIAVTSFHNIIQQIKEASPDLILLDLGLPGQDGLALCAKLRQDSEIPIIFVTSRNSTADEMAALCMGGDDYISKPYNIPLLLTRIKVVLRRSIPKAEPDYTEINGLRLNPTKGTASANNLTTELTRNEIQILAYLMANAGKIVSRADLIEALWNSKIYIDDNTLSVNITRLRDKLKELGLTDYIKTRRGIGYQI